MITGESYNFLTSVIHKLKAFVVILIILQTANLCSQQEDMDSLNIPYEDYIFVKPGDTITIKLNEFSILPKHHFASQEDLRYYYWFKRKVFKAYPYATLAAKRLDSLNARLERIPSKRSRKKYVTKIQRYLEGEFTDQLKKMTTTEGRVLIKLIHRQTGKTVFEHIKEIRSGWKAFWYNTTATVFKLSLKEEYQPASVNEDYLIEEILQRAYINDALEHQPSKIPIDFLAIATQKKGEINVEEYKKMFAKIRKKRKRKKKSSS